MKNKGGKRDKSEGRGGVPNITDLQDFEQLVAATGNGKPLVIDFTATWCPPCKQIGPIFVAMADEPAYKNSVTFVKCDVDQADEVSEACGIEAMPSFVMFTRG